jgi:hypothetical protein
MAPLDVRQVLTIPKVIKAQEVVKRGFMSNLLFQNISGIFASAEAREILEQLNPVAVGKVVPSAKSEPIGTQNVEVDDIGNAVVDPTIVVAMTDAKFGEKVYADVISVAEKAVEQSSDSLSNTVAKAFTHGIMDTVKEIAKDNFVTVTQAEQVVKNNANVLAREVQIVKKQAEIKEAEAKAELYREVAAAANNETAVQEAKARYEVKAQEIAETLQQELTSKVAEKTRELTQKSTEEVLQKAEEKKKSTVEDDIRSRLRGFARTIPSFLMAYGEPTTTLANFDKNITDSVFKEVTGITLDQFRDLRDKFNFFDPVVFDESVQEFLLTKKKLANYFDDSQTEDIFDYIPPQKTNQIYTPKKVVKLMIDKLEDENPDIFTNKDKTFADLYVKSGLYLTEIVKRLYAGLESTIPDKDARLRHILEKQIYGFAPSEIIYNIAKSFVYGGFADIDSSHLVCRDLTETAKNGGDLDMKFDAVVGNPPYQEDSVGGSTSNAPIYHYFIDTAYSIADKAVLITPARFLFNAGATPKTWNEKMMTDTHLKVLLYEEDATKVFPTPSIIGGVAITYHDQKKEFTPISIFTSNPLLNSILDKVKVDDESLSSIISGRGVYRLTDSAITDFPEIGSIQSKGHSKDVGTGAFEILDKVIYFEKQPQADNYIQIYELKDSKRAFYWMKETYLDYPTSFKQYKVFLSKANGAALNNGTIVGVPLVVGRYIGATETFLTIGGYETELEAENLAKYIKT